MSVLTGVPGGPGGPLAPIIPCGGEDTYCESSELREVLVQDRNTGVI